MSSAAKRSRYPRINSKSAAKRPLKWLTEDLIVEVFLRLPKKFLLRFRSVSKGLCNLIDSSVFKKRYDIFHNSVSAFAVMHMEAGRLFSMDFHLPDNLDSSAEKEVRIPHNNNPRFIGSCKGIVCLGISPAPMDFPAHDSFILLNPFNTTYQKVISYQIGFSKSMGFGYDSATDDYKIVKLQHHDYGTIRYLNVYSMRRDSWRQVIREISPGCSPQVDGICVEVEGAMHWKGFNRTRNGYSCIAAFDLETEVFRSLPLPPQFLATTLPWSLHILGGRLSVIVKSPYGRTTLWVMEEYGVETSWTRLLTMVNDITSVVGYFPMWDSARLLCLGSDSTTLSWLNTQDYSKEDIQIHKLPNQQGNNQTWNETWVCVRSPLKLRRFYLQND